MATARPPALLGAYWTYWTFAARSELTRPQRHAWTVVETLSHSADTSPPYVCQYCRLCSTTPTRGARTCLSWNPHHKAACRTILTWYMSTPSRSHPLCAPPSSVR
ncbi:hypothetical protein LZ30DRAFT_706667 [Colletotrichum cereale]|nr:hypothetical protein LZ30DRAFT_706667 [Colletotrichum cereale]